MTTISTNVKLWTASLLLVSCAGGPGALSLGFTGGAQSSDAEDPLSGTASNDIDGATWGARAQYRVPTDFYEAAEVGVRIDVSQSSLEKDDHQLRGWTVNLGPSVRIYLSRDFQDSIGMSQKVRPYFETFGGVSWAEKTLTVDGVTGHLREDGVGGHLGAGAGVEYELRRSMLVNLGIEYTHTGFGFDDVLDVDSDRIALLAGISIRF